ncbi:MAG: peptidylprolyl isomerase [Gammaproteobacteria bacterium]|nr:peptidylprolyl isomerase [Gammaproteobacteria bacterium]
MRSRLPFVYRILAIGGLLFFSFNIQAQEDTPQVAREHIVFSTIHGDLVFALYPEIAPLHVEQLLKLTRLGVFDSAQVMRVIPGFIVHFSDSFRRLKPLTREQSDAVQPIKAEFTNKIRHTKGRLTMARYDDKPDSATSSFSILLGNAPHLDGAYTIFGHLESGGSVIDKILSIPLKGESPSQRIIINRAYVIDDIEGYFNTHPRDPADNMGFVKTTQVAEEPQDPKKATLKQHQINHLIAILLGAIIMVSMLGVLLQKHIGQNRLISLLLVNVLISGFGLFIIMTPQTATTPWLGFVLFMAIFGLFRLMSRFEKSA